MTTEDTVISGLTDDDISTQLAVSQPVAQGDDDATDTVDSDGSDAADADGTDGSDSDADGADSGADQSDADQSDA